MGLNMLVIKQLPKHQDQRDRRDRSSWNGLVFANINQGIEGMGMCTKISPVYPTWSSHQTWNKLRKKLMKIGGTNSTANKQPKIWSMWIKCITRDHRKTACFVHLNSCVGSWSTAWCWWCFCRWWRMACRETVDESQGPPRAGIHEAFGLSWLEVDHLNVQGSDAMDESGLMVESLCSEQWSTTNSRDCNDKSPLKTSWCVGIPNEMQQSLQTLRVSNSHVD